MIDLKELAALIANILGGEAILAVVIFAVTAQLKAIGLNGWKLTASAFVQGLVIALLVRYAMLPAVSFADWVWTGLFGLMAGLMATGAYKGIESATGKEKITAPSTFYDEAGNITGYGKS
jgi:hypothetical protein